MGSMGLAPNPWSLILLSFPCAWKLGYTALREWNISYFMLAVYVGEFFIEERSL